jgi:hypothetical protein
LCSLEGGALRIPVLAFCLCVLVGVASAADSLHVRCIGKYEDPSIIGFGTVVRGDLAYIAGNEDFLILSVADPANPVEVGRCSTPVLARGLDVAGDYAYVAESDPALPSLRVISVADPTNPVEVGHCDMPAQASDVAVSGGYAYVADNNGGLRVISVADPTQPVEVGHCLTTGQPYHLKVVGDCVYIGAPYDGGLRIVSVADPTQPVEVGGYKPGLARAVAVSSDYAYVGCGDLSFRVISVVDRANPVEVGRIDSLVRNAEGVEVIRGHVFVASFQGIGLVVVSVADPAQPKGVGYYGINACYSIAVNEDYVYVGTFGGFWIFQFYQDGDLDVDNDSLDVVADTLRLPPPDSAGPTLGEFVLVNTSAAYNPDTIDGPSVSPVDSLRFTGSLTGPDGTIDSILITNLPSSLAQGQAIVCTLAVYVPPGMQNGTYAGSITVMGRDTAGLLVQDDLHVRLTVKHTLGDLDVGNDSLDVTRDTIRVRPRLVSSRPPPEYTEYALGEFILANTSTTYNPDTFDGPSQSPVDSLRCAGSLTGPGGTLDSILIPNLPAYLAQGQTAACSLVVRVPLDLPVGDYSGPIVISGYDSLHYEVAETVYALVQKLGDLDIDNDSLDVARDTVDLRTQPAGPAYHPYAKARFMLVSSSESYNPDAEDGPGQSLLRAVKVEAKVEGENGTLDSVYVLNLPESLAVGQAIECTLALVLPVGATPDGHAGWVTISAYDTLGYQVRDSFFLTVRGPQPRQNLDSLRVAPIPFKPNQNPEHDAIHFQGLSAGAKVIVYDASGQSVWSAAENGDGHLKWDAKVASGIYVYLVVSADGKASKVGKLSVIR